MMGPMRTGNKRAVDFSADAVAHNQDDHDSDNEPLNERSDRVDATRAAAKKAVEAARQAAKAEGLELRKGAKGYEGVYRTQQGAFQAIWRQEGVLDKHLGYGTVPEEAALECARRKTARPRARRARRRRARRAPRRPSRRRRRACRRAGRRRWRRRRRRG